MNYHYHALNSFDLLLQKDSDSEENENDIFDDNTMTSPLKRKVASRRAATKVNVDEMRLNSMKMKLKSNEFSESELMFTTTRTICSITLLCKRAHLIGCIYIICSHTSHTLIQIIC